MDPLPTLLDVVVGDANRKAFEACRTMCDEHRSLRCPLVLEGPSGTGKSFLLGAMSGELHRLQQGAVVTFRGANLTEHLVASATASMLERPPAALFVDDADAVPAPPQLVSPLRALLGELCLRGTRVAMACRRWTPELDILLWLPAASGLPVNRIRCMPIDLEMRRAIVARLSDTMGANAEADAVDLLARASLPDASHLVALAGMALARARLKGLPMTADAVVSALWRLNGRRRGTVGTHVRSGPVRPVQPVAEHLDDVPVAMPEPGLFPSFSADVLGGLGPLGRALSTIGPGQRLALEEQPDDGGGSIARRAAIRAAMDGRTVLFHTPEADAEAVARSLVALLCGGADPADTKQPTSVRRVTVRAEVLLAASRLYLSDDPAVPTAHAGAIARELQRSCGITVDLVVTEGPVLDRPLATCTLDFGGALIAATPPGGVLAPAWRAEPPWAFARHEGRTWVRCRDDWCEVEGPSVPRPDVHLPPLMQDKTGAAVGWRLWQLREKGDGAPSLVSPVKATPWSRGVLTSSCGRCGTHPTAGCTCGIYAHISPEDLVLSWRQHTDLVAGKVRAWGTVIRHTDGFRAQHAQIDTLYIPAAIAAVGDELGRRYDCCIGRW